ncbi:MAG TPA: hypothetical protein VF193_09070 [Steroidobacter sp.]
MARVPRGAELIENSVSYAPRFRIENLFVLAGIPAVARAMFEAVTPKLAWVSDFTTSSEAYLL